MVRMAPFFRYRIIDKTIEVISHDSDFLISKGYGLKDNELSYLGFTEDSIVLYELSNFYLLTRLRNGVKETVGNSTVAQVVVTHGYHTSYLSFKLDNGDMHSTQLWNGAIYKRGFVKYTNVMKIVGFTPMYLSSEYYIHNGTEYAYGVIEDTKVIDAFWTGAKIAKLTPNGLLDGVSIGGVGAIMKVIDFNGRWVLKSDGNLFKNGLLYDSGFTDIAINYKNQVWMYGDKPNQQGTTPSALIGVKNGEVVSILDGNIGNIECDMHRVGSFVCVQEATENIVNFEFDSSYTYRYTTQDKTQKVST